MENQALTLTSITEVQSAAQIFVQSGYFKGVNDAAKAMVKIMAGQELQIPPIASMRGFDLVDGQIQMRAHLMAATLKRSGKYDYTVLHHDNERCEIEFFDATGGSMGTSTFTMDDARQAKLTGKDNWTKYPRAMLYNRAMAEGARMYCPDIFLGAVYADGEIVEDPMDAPQTNRRKSGMVIAADVDDDGAWTGDFIDGEAKPVDNDAYMIPEGKRTLLTQKLADLGWRADQIDKRLTGITTAQETEDLLAETMQRWEAKAKQAELVFDGDPSDEPDDIPDDRLYSNAGWNPIFEAMASVGVSHGDFEAYLLSRPMRDGSMPTSVDDLGQSVIKKFKRMTDDEATAKDLAIEVRRVLSKAEDKGNSDEC